LSGASGFAIDRPVVVDDIEVLVLLIETSVDIIAPAERVWQVMADVERWPEWTASINSIRFAGAPPLEAGAKLRVRQPKLPAAVWTVTHFDPGRGFEWRSKGLGLNAFAGHYIEAIDANRSRATLRFEQSGLLAGVIGALMEGRARRYVEMEAQGLKARSEADTPTADR
jgi:uncharacterized membrane protein